jgi:hypothetical protein
LITVATLTVVRSPVAAPARIAAFKLELMLDRLGIVGLLSIVGRLKIVVPSVRF